MEENYTQKPLSKEEILAEFANTTFDARLADFFYDRYLDEFEVWEDYDNPNEMALKCVRHGLMWYALYKQIGHHKLWCEEAYSFGCEWVEIEISLENEVICMFTIEDNLSCYSPDIYRVTKKAEYVKHLSHIKEAYNKDDVFMRFYSEFVFGEFGFDHDILDFVSQRAYRYNYAITEGKTSDFAYFYATWGRCGAWQTAELRERLQKEGWDEDYIRTYLYCYADGLEEGGEEREHPDIPAYWEEKVDAFMKGWDYARKHNLDIKFAERFRDIYLNLAHPDEIPDYPFSETENKAIEETLKLYGKSI